MKIQSSSYLSIQQHSEQNTTTALTALPNEILLYILKQFLNLDDLWRLLQVSRTFRIFALHTIYRRWKIELSPESTMKIQCRAALVALEALSCQLSTQTRVTPFAYQTSYLSAGHTNPAAATSFVSASSGMPDPAASTTTAAAAAAAVGLLDQRRTGSTRSLSPYYYYYDDDDDDDYEEENLEEDDIHPQRLLLLSGSRSSNNGSSSTNDNSTSSGSHGDNHVNSNNNNNNIDNQEEDREYDEEYNQEVEEVIIDQQQQEQQQQEYQQHQRDNTNKLFYHLMRREEKLHKRIVLGISSYKHKYVLIEDIDIRNRIRSAVDVIFHHAVFVTAVSRPPIRLACTHASSKNRALAAMMVRLLTRLDVAFPSCCREITFTLADNIKAFLEYTGYKLMSLSKVNKSMTQHEGEILYSMVFGPACQSSAICNSSSSQPPPMSISTTTLSNNSNNHNTATISTINNYNQDNNHNNNSQHINNNNNRHKQTSTPPIPPQISSKLLDTLHSISACFDLMGAAFIGKILSENHVECAVQRACELLSDSYLRPIKRALLVDLLEGWLTIKRGLVASELCRWVQTEIERCDQQSSTSSLLPMTAATATATTMRTTSSLYPPLSDLVSLAHLPLAS
ncbi:hypothetical protein INT45_009140 [Circinella minor]|uniref:F-box domain-containing protein n=1 Tax=Circinella minor TaxID=1195481 RepID=A0A8H7SER6_9FUNG|nr:hypothetical protein INT45_009140 [Circinella minor]